MDKDHLEILLHSLRSIEDRCQNIQESVASHIEDDQAYWKKVDQVEGQVSLIKWAISAVGATGLAAWLGLGKH